MNAHHLAKLTLLPFFITALAVCSPAASSSTSSSSGEPPPPTAGVDPGKQTDATSSNENEGGTDTPAPGATTGGCINDAPAFDAAKMRTQLEYLASKELAGRAPGTPGDLAARKYIEDRFKCLGVEPGGPNGSYVQQFTDSEGTSSANVVGMIKGSDTGAIAQDIIVVSAHIDHFGTLENEGLRLGANDNASGIVAVLQVAQAIKQKGAPKRTIAFMVFGSEELGCEGSHHYVKNSLAGLPFDKVVYDVNFDMVGTYSQNGNKVLAHGTFPKTPATAIVKSLIPAGLKVDVGVPGLGEDDSDYAPFCFAGVPMVAFFTDDKPCYHKACDTSDRIDYPHLAQIVKLGGETVAGLAAATTDLAAARRALKVSDLGCGDDD